MFRVKLAFVFLAFGSGGFANAVDRNADLKLGKIRRFVDALEQISKKVSAELEQESALYREVNSFCSARQQKARSGAAIVDENTDDHADSTDGAGAAAADSTADAAAASDAEAAAGSDATDDASGVSVAPAASVESVSATKSDAAKDSAAASTENSEVESDEDASADAKDHSSAIESTTEASAESTSDSSQDAAPKSVATQEAHEAQTSSDEPADNTGMDEAEAEAHRVAQEMGAANDAPVESQTPTMEKAPLKIPAPAAKASIQNALEDLVSDAPDSTEDGSSKAEPSATPTATVSSNSEKAPTNTGNLVSQALDDLVSDTPASATEGDVKTVEASTDKSTIQEADNQLLRLQRMQAMLNSDDEDFSVASINGKPPQHDAITAFANHGSAPVQRSNLRTAHREKHAASKQNRPVKIKATPAATPAQAKTAHRQQVKTQPPHSKVVKSQHAKASLPPAPASKKSVRNSNVHATTPMQKEKKAVVSADVSDDAKFDKETDEAEMDAEEELGKMQEILGSNADELKAVSEKASHDPFGSNRKVKKPQNMETGGAPKKPQNMESKVVAKVKQPSEALKPPNAIVHFPLMHEEAAPQAKAATKQVVKMHARKIKSVDKFTGKKNMKVSVRTSDQEAFKDLEQDAEKMNDLLNFVPANEVAPSVEVTKSPVKAAAPAHKKDKDSVVAESEDLESIIDSEEAKLNSRQEGAESQLKRQLKAYAESSGDMDDGVITEDKIEETGLVKFDPQALSAVSDTAGSKTASQPSPPVVRQTVAAKAVPEQTDKVGMKKPISHPQPQIPQVQAEVVLADSEDDIVAPGDIVIPVVMPIDQQLTPMQELPPAPKVVTKVPTAVVKSPVVAEVPKKDDLSLASQSEALDDLAGAIPNIEKEALQLYNSFGGQPAPLESVDSISPLPSFLQMSKRKMQQKHTPGLPTPAQFDAAFAALRLAAKRTQGAMSMVQHMKKANLASKSVLGLIQKPGLSDRDINKECKWLMNNFQHRQVVRNREEKLLQEAHELIGSMHVYLQRDAHKISHLRGRN
jgi:hypothetical protein